MLLEFGAGIALNILYLFSNLKFKNIYSDVKEESTYDSCAARPNFQTYQSARPYLLKTIQEDLAEKEKEFIEKLDG